MHSCLSGIESSDQTSSSNGAVGRFSLEEGVSSSLATLSTSMKNCSVFVWMCGNGAGYDALLVKDLHSCGLTISFHAGVSGSYWTLIIRTGQTNIPVLVRNAICWWLNYIYDHKWKSVIPDEILKRPNRKVSTDVCLSRGKAWFKVNYFKVIFSPDIVQNAKYINKLELCTVLHTCKSGMWTCNICIFEVSFLLAALV